MQKSVAVRQFPQIVWQDGKKHLWNPIQRKRLKNLPEERVRLRIIEYLLQGGWSKHRISAEEAISSAKNTKALRTDIICYTQQFDPFLLVECKAESVPITGQTADQIARYNTNVNASYLLMTNGRRDFWYEIADDQSVRALDDIPDPLPAVNHNPQQKLDYWKARSFAGKSSGTNLRKWLVTTLNNCYLQSHEEELKFLSFNQAPSDLDLQNYYLILPQPGCRIAASFSSTPFGSSRLIAVINKENKNTGMLEVNLDLLFDDESPNASFYSAGGVRNIDARKYIDLTSEPLVPQTLSEKLYLLLQKLES